MTQAPSRGPEFWASLDGQDRALALFRFHQPTAQQQIWLEKQKRWDPYSGSSFEDVLEGRFPVLTREEAAHLFPNAELG